MGSRTREDRAWGVVVCLAVALLTVAAPRVAAAALFAVNTVDDNDDGICNLQHCSLREAMKAGEATDGRDQISFLIPPFDESVHTIHPLSPLPILSDPDGVEISGLSQPGSSGRTGLSQDSTNAKLLIELHGNLAGSEANGLVIEGGQARIEGIVVNAFAHSGIALSGGSEHAIENVFVGTDAGGQVERPNGAHGIIVGAPGTNVRNCLVAANTGDGIRLESDGNVVLGTLAGGSASGEVRLGNGGAGIALYGAGNTIGSTGPSGSNFVRDNAVGMLLSGSDAHDNTVVANVLFENRGDGIALTDGAHDNVLGSRGPGPQRGTSNNYLGNQGSPVRLTSSAGNNNLVLPYLVAQNGGIPIDLEGGVEDAEGRTANDEGDGDDGPNGLLNSPVIISARECRMGFARRICVDLSYTGQPNQMFVPQFYVGASCEALYAASPSPLFLETDAEGHAQASAIVQPPSVFGGTVVPNTIAVLATNLFPVVVSSEMSVCIDVEPLPTPTVGSPTVTPIPPTETPPPRTITSTPTFLFDTPTRTPSPRVSFTPSRTPTLVAGTGGDANCDARINAADAIEIERQIGAATKQCGADVDASGAVDGADLQKLSVLLFE